MSRLRDQRYTHTDEVTQEQQDLLQKLLKQNEEFRIEIDAKKQKRLNESTVSGVQNYEEEMKQIQERKQELRLKHAQMRHQHQREERAETRKINQAQKEVENLHLKLAEVYKERKIIELKVRLGFNAG